VNEWLHLARSRPIVHRALKYAIGVGTALVVINHGDALLRGDVSLVRLLRIALTLSVPYMVSTASSVGAILERKGDVAQN
jgi:hypothetical protein